MKDKPPKNLTGKTIVTPQGKIRPGKCKPFRKSTLARQAEIIDFVAKMLVRQASRYEIHKAVEQRYDIGWSQTDLTYIPRARALVKSRTTLTKEDALEIGLSTLIDVLKTEKGSVRVQAERRLGEIFGYDAPKRTELSGPGGKPIQTEDLSSALDGLSVTELRSLITACRGEPDPVPVPILIAEPAKAGGNGGNGRNGGNGNGQH